MTSIIIDRNFANSDLDVEPAWGAQIRAKSALAAWFQADPEAVTLDSGKIATWVDRKAGTLTLTSPLSNSGVPEYATLESAALAGYPAAKFNAATWNRYRLSSGFDLGQPFSIAAIVKPVTGTSLQPIFGRFNSTTQRAIAVMPQVSGGSAQLLYGTTPINLPCAFNEWQLFVWTHTGTLLKAARNGVRVADVASDQTAGASGSAGMVMGALSNSGSTSFSSSYMSDVFLYQGDAFTDGLDALLLGFAQDVYGIGL